MPTDYTTIGVVIAKRQLKSVWADHAWLPVAVLPDPPDVPAWTPLGTDGDDERFYLGPAALAFHTVETANYRDNLLSTRPAVWVAIRPSFGDDPVELAGVTVDPSEGEAMAGVEGDIVDAVPMPSDIAAALARFTDDHHVERAFVKRQRKPADPEALARGRIVRTGEDE
jgi:hypothetical protein